MKFKNPAKVLLVVEIQVVLVLLILGAIKLNSLEEKVFNTNRFLYEIYSDQRVDKLNKVRDSDIVIGGQDACLTLFIYSRFDCPACNDFFETNYPQLKKDFIDEGKIKVVFRYLVHASKKNTLIATKYAYYANSLGKFNQFIDETTDRFPELDTPMLNKVISKIRENDNNLETFISDPILEKKLLKDAREYRQAKITSTPTIFVNNQIVLGYSNYKRLKEIIDSELQSINCE